MLERTSRRKADPTSEDLAQRASAPLYRDPFEGICAHARALTPDARAKRTQNCPRCGWQADPDVIDPDAGCLLEGTALDLASLQVDRG